MSRTYRQFVLLAALLLVTIGLGTLGLRALVEQRAAEERQTAMHEALGKGTADAKAESDAAAPVHERHDAPRRAEAPPATAGTLRSSDEEAAAPLSPPGCASAA